MSAAILNILFKTAELSFKVKVSKSFSLLHTEYAVEPIKHAVCFYTKTIFQLSDKQAHKYMDLQRRTHTQGGSAMATRSSSKHMEQAFY